MHIKYSRFRFVAVVDWVELEVRTINKHPAWRVQRASAGALSYVTGLDPVAGQDVEFTGQQGANTPTTRFAVRIQAPERFATITSALTTIADLDQCATITVRGIEIAFDAYRLRGTTDDQLTEMVAYMLRTTNRPYGSNDAPRFYSWRGTPELRYGEKAVLVPIQDGKTGMYGNKDDDYVVRGYLKNYDSVPGDNGKSQRVKLNNRLDHRARIEVRLQGERSPVHTLDDLMGFKFESLARFFKFHEIADDLKVIETLVASKAGSLGSVIDQGTKVVAAHANQGRARKTKNGSQASPLNEKARDQLRNLSLRWRCESGRSRRRFDGDSGSKPVSGHTANYPNVQVPQHPEGTGHIREISTSQPAV